jgi:3-hydroxyisobutyrate dehydrogenase-like beta-hydroxyacid dehydrogenase
MAKIGVVGLGIMGSGMARNLAKHGHQVTGWTRSRANTPKDLGNVTIAPSIAAALQGAAFILISVTGPEAQRDVIGEAAQQGVLAHIPKGALVLDATTTDPELTVSFHKQFEQAGAVYADTPVFGSKNESWEGKLDVMFGGTTSDFARAEPVLKSIAKTVTHVGPAGTAMNMKLIGNMMVASQFMALAEAMAIACRTGVTPEILAHMLDNVDFGSDLLRNNARSAAKGDYTPFFQLKDMLKDTRLAEDLGRRAGVPMLATAVATQSFQQAVNSGHGRENVSALIAHVEALSQAE